MTEDYNPNRRPTRREFLRSAIEGTGAGLTEISAAAFARKRLGVPDKITFSLYGAGLATLLFGLTGQEEPIKNGFNLGAMSMAVYYTLESLVDFLTPYVRSKK